VGKIRKAAVAGQFYERKKEDLEERIKDCFLDRRGPGELPEINQGEKEVKGVVVPHAGYIFSGAIAAQSYYLISQHGFADTFLILGPNHSGMGSGVSVMTEGQWETPLGSTSINQPLARQLHRGIIDADETAHKYEHSIEVQLPFLQFAAGNKKFDFVPLCMGMQDFETSQEVGEILAEAVQKASQHIVIVASSDFSHVGFNYMSMPPAGTSVNEYAKKQDRRAIEKILQLDPQGLIDTIHNHNITMCGYGPVAAMLVAARILGAEKAELLKYGSSYEVQPGSSCVGYGALAVY
jgi:hypothetical protein